MLDKIHDNVMLLIEKNQENFAQRQFIPFMQTMKAS